MLTCDELYQPVTALAPPVPFPLSGVTEAWSFINQSINQSIHQSNRGNELKSCSLPNNTVIMNDTCPVDNET
jgi:hypothetical protein